MKTARDWSPRCADCGEEMPHTFDPYSGLALNAPRCPVCQDLNTYPASA